MICRDDDGWVYINGIDADLPWKNGFYCKGCQRITNKPIQVKHKIHTALYCPHCSEFIKTASKKELATL